MVDFLGPLIGVAVAATLAPDPWFEPLPDIFFVAFGATGFWRSVQTRCTSMQPTRMMHAREPRDMIDLRLAHAWTASPLFKRGPRP